MDVLVSPSLSSTLIVLLCREVKPVASEPAVNRWRRQNSQSGLLTLHPTLTTEEQLHLFKNFMETDEITYV